MKEREKETKGKKDRPRLNFFCLNFFLLFPDKTIQPFLCLDMIDENVKTKKKSLNSFVSINFQFWAYFWANR